MNCFSPDESLQFESLEFYSPQCWGLNVSGDNVQHLPGNGIDKKSRANALQFGIQFTMMIGHTKPCNHKCHPTCQLNQKTKWSFSWILFNDLIKALNRPGEYDTMNISSLKLLNSNQYLFSFAYETNHSLLITYNNKFFLAFFVIIYLIFNSGNHIKSEPFSRLSFSLSYSLSISFFLSFFLLSSIAG